MDIHSWKQKMTYGMILPVATVFAVAFSIERGIFMTRKSRKHQYTEGLKSSAPVAVGYIDFQLQIKKNAVL